MKLLVAFGLFSFGAAKLRPWPSWLPRIPKIPPFITVPGAEHLPPRIFNGLTDPAVNFHVGQSCSVQYEKRLYKGTCQKEDDFDKSALGGCPDDVSLYGCGAESKSNLFRTFNCVLPPKYFSPLWTISLLTRSWMIGGDGNPMRCCVKVHCGKYYENYFCRNKSKQPTGLVFSAWHMYVQTFSPLRS